jgi:hypothetical protein
MDIFVMMTHPNFKQRLCDGWRIFLRRYHAGRSEGRRRRLQRQVRRLVRQCAVLQRRMHARYARQPAPENECI